MTLLRCGKFWNKSEETIFFKWTFCHSINWPVPIRIWLLFQKNETFFIIRRFVQGATVCLVCFFCDDIKLLNISKLAIFPGRRYFLILWSCYFAWHSDCFSWQQTGGGVVSFISSYAGSGFTAGNLVQIKPEDFLKEFSGTINSLLEKSEK